MIASESHTRRSPCSSTGKSPLGERRFSAAWVSASAV